MRLDLEKKEVETVRNLVNNRIQELRDNMSGEASDNEDELRKIIRGYKSLLKKIDNEIEIDNK